MKELSQSSVTPPPAAPYAGISRWGLAGILAAVTIRAVVARLPGWNPVSLWQDDLVWAALTRAQDLRTLLSVPAHVPPGFLAILWGTHALFPDPEWSLQLLPFAAGIAAIPVMAAAVRRLTRSDGLAMLAGALTALNPLLAHYTVFVKQYSFDFLVTALLLWSGAAMLSGSEFSRRGFARLSVLSGLAVFFSMTSVFVSFPIVNLLALRAWLARRRDRWPVLAAAAIYNTLVFLGYLVLRTRTNELVKNDFRRGFLGSSSIDAVWAFSRTQGRRLIETSLPSWKATPVWNPETVSWTLPIIGLGLVWLLVRRSTRAMGCVVLGFYAAFLLAARMMVYPLGMDRTDIFAFPMAMCLFIMGVHFVTEWMPKREVSRIGLGLVVAVFALYAPVRAQYWGVNDVGLIKYLTAVSGPADGLILSPNGSYLAAYYGPWPVVISSTAERTNATDAEIIRDLTLHLSPNQPPQLAVDAFLKKSRPNRLWYVAFRAGDEDDVLQALTAQGYVIKTVDRTSKGSLYLGVNVAGTGHE